MNTRLALALLALVATAVAHPTPASAGTGDQQRPQAASCCTGKAAPASSDGYARSRVSIDVPDVTLLDTSGGEVSLRQLVTGDDPVLLNFFFTSCTTICPVLTATFAQVQGELGAAGDRARLVSISIDPEHDTPDRLRGYAETRGAGSRWLFLTGPRAAVESVQKAFGAYRGSKFNHAPLTYIHIGHEEKWTRLEGLGRAKALLAEYRQTQEPE